MPRASKGAARRQSKNRWFAKAKGNRGFRRKNWRTVKQTVIRSGVYAYRDRRLVKRDYRRLWIVRVNAAARAHGVSHSRFMHGLKLAGVALNRKMLSELAIHDPAAFEAILGKATEALESQTAAAA